MYSPRLRKYQCHYCNKYVYASDVASEVMIDGMKRYICIKCHLSRSLYDAIINMLTYGDEEGFRQVARVLQGVSDLIEENPLAQAVVYVINEWSQKYPGQTLYVKELESKWRYNISLQQILGYLSSTGIFIIDGGALSPGHVLKKLLLRFPSSKDFFKDVIKIVTGLAVIRYAKDPLSKKFRMLFATLQAINACIDDEYTEPYYEIKGYKCKFCGAEFALMRDAKRHALEDHSHCITTYDADDEESLYNSFEVLTGKQLGVLCRYEVFIEKAGAYGVSNIGKFMRYLLTKGVIVPPESDDLIVVKKGKKYIVVDLAWIRVRERMRDLERQLRRGM